MDGGEVAVSEAINRATLPQNILIGNQSRYFSSVTCGKVYLALTLYY